MKIQQLPLLLLTLLMMCLVSPIAQAGGKKKEKKLTDPNITSAITSRLNRDPAVSSHLIDVETNNGVVTLSGSVDNILAKERSVKLATTIKGVRSVVDQMQVKPVRRSDNEIREDVEDALLFDPATDSYEISARVKDATVTLSGTVESWQEKQLAKHVAMGVKGVKEVDNNIAITFKTNRPDDEIKSDIRRQLETNVWVDDGWIDVKVDDGEVTLAGTVGSAMEKRQAHADAWVSGVTSVNSDELNVELWAREKLQRKDAYTPKTDEEIAQAVRDSFVYDPRVYSFNPEVFVDNGVVTLTGVVDNLKAKRAAEHDAKNTIGVVRVKNYLRVRPTKEYSDEQIAENVRSALLWDPDVSRYEVTVSVFNGRVYLSGEVDSYFERWQAEDVASRVNGVVDVSNNITVEYDPVVTYPDYPYTAHRRDTELEEDIEDELWWSPFVDSTTILVSVENGTATLSGTVSSHHEMNKAIENALEGGADNVVNNLTIRPSAKD